MYQNTKNDEPTTIYHQEYVLVRKPISVPSLDHRRDYQTQIPAKTPVGASPLQKGEYARIH
jgi:hypothetical protein